MTIKSVEGRDFEVGVLKPETVRVYPPPNGDYYSLLTGENPDGETRSMITRGAGKQLGATRVPLQIMPDAAKALKARGLSASWPYDRLVNTLKIFNAGRGDTPTWVIKVLLVQMPREGNSISGLEWNAPGGTGELGESADEVAAREFHEESGLTSLWAGTDFPECMFASGVYDETQNLSLALVVGNPDVLVEGAKRWTSVSLQYFRTWARNQNQTENEHLWQGDTYCPVDGKVIALLWSFIKDLGA